MAQIDFDLARYIAYRKGRVLQRARDGAAYGFSRELRHRRNLVALRAVAFAIDATSRQWKGSAKSDLLAASTRASSITHSRLFKATEAAANALMLEHHPPVYVSSENAPIGAWALGTEDDCVIVVHPLWLDALPESELQALVGRTLAYLQNNLVPYSTALYYLEHNALFFVRWIVAPAIMALRAWSRRADITCDRAGLICTRNVGISAASILRSAGGFTGPLDYDTLNAPPGVPAGPISELIAEHQGVRHRIAALHVFSKTYLYSQLIKDPNPGGITTDKADETVAEILES